MQGWKRIIAVVAIASTLWGCATIMAGGPDVVPVLTNPPGAQVVLNGQIVGYTPTTIMLNRDQPAQIQLLLAGFQPVVLHRSKHFNGWFVGSILLLYLIFPIIVDVVTGNVTKYDDTGIAIGMTPLPGYYPPPMQQPPVYQPPPGAQPPPR